MPRICSRQFPRVEQAVLGNPIRIFRRGPAGGRSAGGEIAIVQDALVFRCLLIDGDHHGAGARRLDAVQHFTIVVQFRLGIELKPERAFGRRRDLLERKAGDIAHNVGSIGCGNGALIGGHFAIRVKHGVAGGRRNQDGVSHRGAEDLGGRMDGAGVENPVGKQLHPIESLTVAAEGELAVRPVGRVVVVVAWDLGVCHGFEVECRDEFVQRGNAAVIAEGILLGVEQRRAGKEACHGPEGVSAIQAGGPNLIRHAARSLQRGFSLKEYHQTARQSVSVLDIH